MQILETLKKYFKLDLNIDGYFKIDSKQVHSEFEYYQLNGTKFEFKYNNTRVLHFTSIRSAQLILENNYLLGSNFNKFKDKFEITAALHQISNNLTNNWSEIKGRTFAISFTELTDKNVQDTYKYHWNNFANNCKGVALEFEFTKLKLPYSFYPLRINYIKRNHPLLEKIRRQTNNEVSLDDNEKEFLLPILASIKDQDDFESEKEVRLMYKLANSDIEHLDNSKDKNIFFTFNDDNSINLELRIPFSTPNIELPKSILTLKKVHLGKTYNSEDQMSSFLLNDCFERLCKEKGVELKY